MGIDAGSTSCKVGIFDERGKIIASSATPSVRIHKQGEGFEEIELHEMWSLIAFCISSAIRKADISSEEIKGIGATSYGNGVVFVGRDKEVIAPRLPVPGLPGGRDSRSLPEERKLREDQGDRQGRSLRRRTRPVAAMV
ncbi:MAG: hypothetical protein IKE16_01920 [Solobacterium sp.]|nr:hypothetical protein [Solobacterium sp.]